MAIQTTKAAKAVRVGGKETFCKIVEFIERRLELLGFRSMPLLLA